MLRLFLLSFVVSMAVGYLILRCEHIHARFTGDTATRGSHKVHRSGVSRIGGVAIFIGWLVALAVSAYQNVLSFETAVTWTVCLLPAFAGGLAEDFAKQVPPVTRLFAAFISATLAYLFLGVAVTRIDVIGGDSLLAIPVVSFLFTCVAVGGVAHAVNIIDGLNGLASGVCLIALIALGYVAFQVADWQILLMCGIGAGALLGFRVWNYPSGRIFCGDGGAYFLGAYVAILSTLLVQRHAEVSAWFPLLLVAYPVWETLFSAYRRRILRGRPASTADRLHMHTLFYKRVKLQLNGGRPRTRRNSDASAFMVLFAGGMAMPAVLWWSDGRYLLASALCYIVVYLMIYRRLVRFRPAAGRGGGNFVKGYVAQRLAAFQRAALSRKTVRK